MARYDSAGNQLWIRQFGTFWTDLASTLAPDGAGGAFVAGTTFGSLGGPSASHPSANFVWKHPKSARLSAP